MASNLDTRIRPEVRNVLTRLKNGIRWYVLAEGLMLTIVLAAVLFWLSFSVDGLWFFATKYELARWFRISFTVFAIVAISFAFVYWIGMRLFRTVRDKALALVLERRFPDLNDRLVTSVEVAQSISGQESDLTVAMLNRTIEDASAEADRLNVRDVFETKPVRWASIGAIAAIISVVGYGAAFPDDFARWANAWVNYEEIYWERDTRLEVHVLDEATGTKRSFDEKQHYRHPRGGQLTLLISVPETDETGKKLIVPPTVDIITTDSESGESQTVTVPRIGDSRTYKYERAQLRESLSFYMVGNDYKNRDPYFVDVVDPPRIDVVKLRCDYPLYTRLNTSETGSLLSVEGRQIAVPIDTRFQLEVTTNKPLLSVQMQYGRYDLAFGWFHDAKSGEITPSADPKSQRKFKAELKSRGLEASADNVLQAVVGTSCSLPVARRVFTFTIPDEYAKNFFVKLEDKTPEGVTGKVGFRLPYHLSELKSDAARQRSADEKIFPGLGTPLLMPPDTEIRMYLEDSDEIRSPEASELTINAVRDLPPEVEAQRTDIGSAIMDVASVPISSTIRDDYGVAVARIEYRVAPGGKTTTEGQPWRSWPLVNEPKRHEKTGRWPQKFEFLTKSGDKELKYEILDVSQIQIPDEKSKIPGTLRRIQPGDLITICVYAEDADDLNGPNIRRSAQLFDFTVVTFQELMFILAEREKQFRIRFEDIIREVEETKKELEERRLFIENWKRMLKTKPEAGKENDHQKKLDQLVADVRFTARNSRSKLTKNHTETREIENGFRQIRAEYVNNKVLTEKEAKRLDDAIIKELNNANKEKTGDYDLVDLSLFRYNNAVDAMEQGTDPSTELDDSLGKIESLLIRLRKAKEEMRKLGEFTDAVNKLGGIIKDQKALMDLTKKLLGQSLFGPGKDPFGPAPKKKP